MMQKLENHDITAEEMGMLISSAESVGEKVEDLIKALTLRKAVAWRIVAPKATGIMVTYVTGDTLFVWYLTGKGLWRVMNKLLAELRALVIRTGLKGLSAETIPSITRFLVRNGFTARTQVSWRVTNGR